MLRLKDGSPFPIFALVSDEHSLLDLIRTPFPPASSIPLEKLADPPPLSDERTEIDILIGLEYYHQLVPGSFEVAPGLWKTPSLLGDLISGRPPHQISSNQAAGRVTNQYGCLTFVTSRAPQLIVGGTCDDRKPEMVNWDDYCSLETVGIKDPPGVAEDDDVRERNRGKIEKNLEEPEFTERIDSIEDGGKENSHREIEPLEDSEKMDREGTPPEMKEFWFRGTEFVDIQKFIERLRRELISDGSELEPPIGLDHDQPKEEDEETTETTSDDAISKNHAPSTTFGSRRSLPRMAKDNFNKWMKGFASSTSPPGVSRVASDDNED